MKPIVRFTIVFVIMHSITNHSIAQWIRTGQPSGIAPITYMYADDNVQLIVAFQDYYSLGIPFFSQDDGKTWIRNSLTGISSFFAYDSVWYMGGISGSYATLYSSPDGGKTWKQFGNLDNGGGTTKFISQNRKTIICGNGWYTYVSTDGGVSWMSAEYGATSVSISDSLVVACDGNTIASPAMQSVPYGYFIQIPSPQNVKCATVLNTSIFCSDGSQIFLSTNKGSTWDTLKTGFSAGSIKHLVKYQSKIYAILADAIYLLDDSLTSWVKYASLPADMNSVEFNHNMILATNTYSLLRSTDKGLTWSGQFDGATNHSGNIYCNDSILFYVEHWRGFHVSSDGGASWLQRNSGLEGVLEFEKLGICGNYLFLTCNNGIYRSSDVGSNWSKVNFPGRTISEYSNNGSTLLAVNPEGGVYTSDNYGLSWNDLTPNIDPKVESGFGLWSGFIHDNDIVLSYFIYSTSEFGIFKSTNRGETWVKIKLPNLTSNYRYKLMLRDGIYYAIGESEVCESEDSGDSWKVIVTVPTSDYRDGITDFYKSGKLMMYNWTGNGENNFMVSEDTGKTWSSYQNNMDRNISVTNFLVFRDTIFASTGGDGIWKRDLDHILYVRNLEGSNKYFTINQNYPNPFNPTTNIDFVIPKPAYTTLKIYDLLGRDVVTIINEVLNPGQYSKKWTAERISSGIYFCILKSGNYSATIKLILQK